MINNRKDWFKTKRYPHIGLPLYQRDRIRVHRYVTNPKLVAKHSFYPFIHKSITTRKFRKTYDDDGFLENNGNRSKGKKKRDIYYANHFDSNVYSYYAHLLSDKYEEILIKEQLSYVVTAYRSIPLEGKNRGMNNVDFAEEAFEFIRTGKEYPLSVTTFDIKSFFDNLDHSILKRAWANILDETSLPDDHYNVFKNITRFSYIEQEDIFDLCKDNIWVTDKNHHLHQRYIGNIRDLKRKNAIAFCETSDFRSHIRSNNKVKSNKTEMNQGVITKRTRGIL